MPLRLPQLGGIAHQRLPQRRLPLLGIAETFHPLAGLPAHQPLRAIDEVLVIEVRHPGGELKQFALVAVIAQILAQQDKIVFLQVLRQEGHQLPAHALLAEGAFARNIFQDAHEHVPDKARRQPVLCTSTISGIKGSSSRWRSTINSINASRTSSRFEWYTLNIIAPDY